MPTLERFDLNETLARLCEIEVEACRDLGYTVTAYPHIRNVPETGLNWRHYVRNGTSGEEDSEDLNRYTFEIAARFCVAPAGGMLPGDAESILYNVLSYFMSYLNSRDLLQSEAYPEPQQYLYWARCLVPPGYTEFADGGTGTPYIGTEFTVIVEYLIPKQQAYT